MENKNFVQGNESHLHFGKDTAVQRSVCKIESIVVPEMKSGSVKCAPALIKLTKFLSRFSLGLPIQEHVWLLHWCISPIPFSLSCTHSHIHIEWPHTTMSMQSNGFLAMRFQIVATVCCERSTMWCHMTLQVVSFFCLVTLIRHDSRYKYTSNLYCRLSAYDKCTLCI